MQAAIAFAAEGAQMLASNTAAQQELLQTGTALVNIAKMYSQVDDTAADTLAFGAPGPLSRLSSQPLAGGSVGAGLIARRGAARCGRDGGPHAADGPVDRQPRSGQDVGNDRYDGAGRRQRRVVGARRRYCPIELVGHRGFSGRQPQGRAGVVGR